MKATDTISVNPGKTALGRVNEEALQNVFRTRVLDREGQPSGDALISALFPSVSAGTGSYAKFAVPLRTVFATILILTGLTLIQSSGSFGLGLTEMIAGGFLAVGLLTRPVMALGAGFFAVESALAFRSGVTDIASLTLMFGCMVMCIVGSGKYSCDFLIRRSILRKSNGKKRHELDYKAFHYANFQ